MPSSPVLLHIYLVSGYDCSMPSSLPMSCCIYTALVSLIIGTVIPISFNILMEMFLHFNKRTLGQIKSFFLNTMTNTERICKGLLITFRNSLKLNKITTYERCIKQSMGSRPHVGVTALPLSLLFLTLLVQDICNSTTNNNDTTCNTSTNENSRHSSCRETLYSNNPNTNCNLSSLYGV